MWHCVCERTIYNVYTCACTSMSLCWQRGSKRCTSSSREGGTFVDWRKVAYAAEKCCCRWGVLVWHELVSTLIGTLWVSRAILAVQWQQLFSPTGWFWARFLGHGKVLDKVKEGHILKLSIGRSIDVVIRCRWYSCRLIFLTCYVHQDICRAKPYCVYLEHQLPPSI